MITRTYKTKKGVIKTYKYDSNKYAKNKVNKVITKKGVVSKRINNILDKVDDYIEREYIKTEIKKVIKEINKGDREAHSYTLEQFKTMYQANRIEIFLNNMGVSVQDLVNNLRVQGEIDVNDVWILDNSHWTFKKEQGSLPTLTLPSGKIAVIQFKYQSGYEVFIDEK